MLPIFFLFAFQVASAVPQAHWQADAMAALEANGLGIEHIFPGGAKSRGTRDLIANPAYRKIVKNLEADLNFLLKKDTRLSTTIRTAHRLFNIKWLSSGMGQFELAAIVNRLDRQPFAPESCGELRFIYRLAYDSDRSKIHSRLPFTFNVVFLLPKVNSEGCKATARRWEELSANVAAKRWAGAKSAIASDLTQLKSIEVNMQSVRWPSTTRGDLGAHAEYLLRVFRVAGDNVEPALLENTPDIEKIERSPQLKKELKAWLKANIQAIDDGVAVLPDKFLATKATSFSPRGLTREANRLWSMLLSPSDLPDLGGNNYVRSPAGLLRRLDDMSCVGCHQNRTVAGFHILGVDREGTIAANSIAVPGSPHFVEDQPRRAEFFASVIKGETPKVFRPLSERASPGPGGFGAHCGLGDKGFAEWTCDRGLTCRDFGLSRGDTTVGQCFSDKSTADIGEPCEVGQMLANRDPHRDRVRRTKDIRCKGVCEANYVGFPEGMCASSCEAGEPNLQCGTIAVLAGFNDCLGRGRPFPSCLQENTRPAGLRACSVEFPCRDDYLCAGTPDKVGTCIPPYFLFQMRVDGHPNPS